MTVRTSMNASRVASQAIGFGLAAVCATLVGFAPLAEAATKLRGARDISGMWGDGVFSFNFDASRKPNEPQKVELQPAYDARYKARLAAVAKGEAEGKPLVDPLTLCLPMGMPSMMRAMFPMEIVVTDKTVYVITESTDPLRRIFLDGRSIPPLDDLNPTFLGLSVGRWEGDTLVVDTAGLKTTTTLENVPHSNELRINERMRLLDDDTMEIVFTLTDPQAFKAPWVITRLYKDHGLRGVKDPGTHPEHKGAELVPGELVCNENNRNLPDENGIVGSQLGGE